MEQSMMAGYQSPYEQYRRLVLEHNASYPNRPWPPSPTLSKNECSPRCPVILMVLPLFLLMTAAPLLSAIFRPQPPSISRAVRTAELNIAPDNHPIPMHPFSAPSPLSTTRLSASSSSFAHLPNQFVDAASRNHLDAGFVSLDDWTQCLPASAYNTSSLSDDCSSALCCDAHSWMLTDVSKCALSATQDATSASAPTMAEDARASAPLLPVAELPVSGVCDSTSEEPCQNISRPPLSIVGDTMDVAVLKPVAALFKLDGTIS